MTHITTICGDGPRLYVRTCDALADGLWRRRASLLREAGKQHLVMAIDLADGGEPIELSWCPPHLPPSLNLRRRRQFPGIGGQP